MAKKVITQRDFSFMQTREDLLEAHGSEIRERSLRGAKNMRLLGSRVVTTRPGLEFLRLSAARQVFEVRPDAYQKFAVAVLDDRLLILNENAATLTEVGGVVWSEPASIWVLSSRKDTLIGDPGSGIYRLYLSGGTWVFENFLFVEEPGEQRAQPYWSFHKGVTIQPSDRVGSIVVTASAPVFTPSHVGSFIRYGGREIYIESYGDANNVNGLCANRLPPSFQLTVDSALEFRVGDAVVSSDSNFQGLVAAVDGPGGTISVVTITNYDGPDNTESISSPTFTSNIVSVSPISPMPSTIWDEQLMSAAHGWPRSATAIAGRLVLMNFRDSPSVIACSSSRAYNDFGTGAEDDDAVIRDIGDGSPRFLHGISAGDLILLSDSGCYFVNIRDSGAITPLTFRAIKFDQRGASDIKPALVEDKVIFVEASGESVAVALQANSSYLKWAVANVTLYHDELIKNPVSICSPAINSPDAEKYMFIVNGDGTLAAVSWSTQFDEESIGFSPWETAGSFVDVMPMFDSYWALVSRVVNGSPVQMLERFDNDMFLDSALMTTNDASPHLPGHTLSYMVGDGYYGDFLAQFDGTLLGSPGVTGNRHIGLKFDASVKVWPKVVVESPYAGKQPARVKQLIVSMKDSIAFQTICNGVTRTLGGYEFGDIPGIPPPRRTKKFRHIVTGRQEYPDIEIVRNEPGPFTIMAIGQEVKY